MSCHPRIEDKKLYNFITTRCRNEELWFVNNEPMENFSLGKLAFLKKRYGASVYAFAIEGNHQQFPALFPNLNRSHFMRDLNSSIAVTMKRLCPQYPGGNLHQRRYSNEFIPAPEDLEHYFFYTVLQPVQDGLVPKISEYPGYNCFHDAVHGIERQFKHVDWAKYNDVRRYNKNARIQDFTEIVTLKYERLPGYENLTQKEYAKLMHQKLEEKRVKIVQERFDQGLGFVGRENLLKVKTGSRARNPKTSTRNSHRPRILCVCPNRRQRYKDWYFRMYKKYKVASEKYRAVFKDIDPEMLDQMSPKYNQSLYTQLHALCLSIQFPRGMYRPYLWLSFKLPDIPSFVT
jgi:hypothetical protein